MLLDLPVLQKGSFYFIKDGKTDLILEDNTKRGLEIKETSLDEILNVQADKGMIHEAKVSSGTVESMTDPGVGHESHQLSILLPPSENVYSGILTYSASEPIQLVSLHGPLTEGEDNGQPIWRSDGETKFALTFVDNESSMETWKFSGNALAVHTKNTESLLLVIQLVLKKLHW